MYQIHSNYTGFFPVGFPFQFTDLHEAQYCCAKLNQMRWEIPSWKDLKEFRIWSMPLGKFI